MDNYGVFAAWACMPVGIVIVVYAYHIYLAGEPFLSMLPRMIVIAFITLVLIKY